MSHFKASGELKQAAPTYFTTTPDVDNVTKFVLDALQPAVLKRGTLSFEFRLSNRSRSERLLQR